MRFIQGVVFGGLLVLGLAYYHDTQMVKGAPQQVFVNWDTLIGAINLPR